MKKAQQARQVARIDGHLEKLAAFVGVTPDDRLVQAERIFRAVSAATHHQEIGNQRTTAKSRTAIDAQVVSNIGAILQVL